MSHETPNQPVSQRVGTESKNWTKLNRKSISVDNVKNVPLQTVTQTAPCASFQFHREWGGVTNPIQLTAGDYQITVNARVNGKKVSQTISFTLETCSFNQNIVVSF